MSLTHYVIYRMDERPIPAGLFVVDAGRGVAALWDHRQGAWAYDPDLVMRFLNDHRNVDRYVTVDRAKADEVARSVTGAAGLPDEEAFHAMFVEAGAGDNDRSSP